jgi:type IV pilus assembly protein PilQ
MRSTIRSNHRKTGLAIVALAAAALVATPSASHAQEDSGQEVVVDDFGTVDISVQDTDLAQVLQMLSLQSRKNIITSKRVSARVTANLYDVTFKEALDAILHVNGYGYIEQGNFIYVYTLEEIAELEKAARTTESRRFTLEYLSAGDAAEFVEPLLSDRGKMSHVGSVEKGFKPDQTAAGEDSWAYGAMLVVNDYPENLDAIDDLLGDLDTPPQQVVVESTVVSTVVNEDNAFGVDFSVIGNSDFIDYLNPLAAANNLIQGNNKPGDRATPDKGFVPEDNRANAVSSTVGNTAGSGGLKVGFIDGDISVFLRVLDEVTDATVLARPRVMALNRQRAQVLVGDRIAYLSTTQTETSTTQTVQFLDTGIRLAFRPFISSDGSIRMELSPSISEAKLRSSTGVRGLGQEIPDERTSEITTNVRMRDGQTLVLGGLFQEDTTVSRNQVPWLGDIPVLGAAFSGQTDKIVRREIMFLITPTIVHDKLVEAWSAEAEEFVDAVRVGSRAGLLPFSRELMSGNHNQDAFSAFESGDYESAMFHINNSLRLNPNQPEIIRLREQISGESSRRQLGRSMMDQILELELARAIESAERKSVPTPERDPMLADESDSFEAQTAEPVLVSEPVAGDPADIDP